jgi:translocation and assembly module TamB
LMSSRALKITGIALAVSLSLMVVAVAAVFVLAGSDGVRDWALAKAKEELAAGPGLELNIGSVSGSLLSTLRFQDLSVASKGRVFFKVKEAEFGIHILQLMGGRLKISPLRLIEPEVSLPLEMDSKQAEDDSPPLLAISVRKIEIKGGKVKAGGALGPLRGIEGIEAKGSFVYDLRGMQAKLDLSGAQLDMEKARFAAAAQVEVVGQKLELKGLSLASGENRLEARGRLDWSKKLEFRLRAQGRLADVALLPLAWPGPQTPQKPLDFRINARGQLERCSLSAELNLNGGQVEGAGLLNLTVPDGNLTINFKDFDPYVWGLSPQALQASGQVQVSSWGKPGDLKQSAKLQADLSRLDAFNTRTKRLNLRADLDAGVVRVSQLEAKGDWGSLTGGGSISLPRGETPMGVEAKLDFKDLTTPPALAKDLPQALSSPRLSGSLQARGDNKNLSLALKLDSSQLAKDVALDSLSAQGGLRQGSWWLGELKASGAWGFVKAHGSLDARRANLDINLDTKDLARVSQAMASLGLAAPELGGSLEALGSLRGTWASPKWEAKVRGRDLAGFDTYLQDAQITAAGGSLRPLRGKVVLLASGLASGEQQWEKLRLELSAGRSVHAFNLQAHSADGWDLSLSADNPADLPMLESITLRRMRMQKPGLPAWVQQGTARLALSSKEMALQGLSLKAAEQSIQISGGWQGRENVRAELMVEGLRLKPLMPEQALPAGAVLDASARLSGSLDEPVMSLKGRVSGLVWPGLPPSKVEFSGDYKGQVLDLAGRALTGGKPSLDLKAALGIELSLHPPVFNLTQRGLSASARSINFPLALLEPVIPALDQIRGQANMRLSAKGSLDKPYLSGLVELDKTAFTVSATGQSFEKVDLALRLEGRRVEIHRASVQSGGVMGFSGWFDLPGNPGARLALGMKAKDFYLSLGVLGDSQFDADLKFAGSWRKPVITGVVNPTKLKVQVGMGPPSDLEEEVVVMKPGDKPPSMDRQPSNLKWTPGGLLGRAEVDLQADLAKGLRVALDDGWLVADGSMRLKKKPQGPFTYHGVIYVKRGLVLLLGKRFNIQRGKLDFADRDEPNPIIDAAVSLKAGKILAQISITGDAMNPHVQVSSEPPMSQADILSTIVFGRPAQSLDQGQSDQLNAQALALLGQRGAREIGQLLSPQLAPDVVTVYQEAQYGSSLEAGKYLSPDLYLRYRQNLSEQGGQNVGLEYRIYDWLSVESQVGDARDTGVDVVYSFDFD